MAELSALIERHMLAPFAWGGEDCCLAVCNVLVGRGWPDPAEPYRGRYSDEAGARALLGGTVEDLAAREFARLGWPEIDPDAARDEDIGLIGNSLAIHADGWWHAKTETGYVCKRRTRRAWTPSGHARMTKARLAKIVLLSTTAIGSVWIGGAVLDLGLPELADKISMALPPALIPLAAAGAGAAATAATSGAVIAGITISATAASIIGSVVAGLVALGLNLLFSPHQTSGGQRDSRTREFDPHPPFRFAIGEFPQEGSVVFHHASGQNYYLTILLNSVPSDPACINWIEINGGLRLEISGLNGDEVDEFGVTANIYDMDKGGNVTEATGQVTGAFGRNSTPEVTFWVGTGEQTKPPQKWLDEIPDVIDATDTWKGATVAHVKLVFGNDKQAARRWTHGKPPPLRFHGKWAKLYDPRLDPASGVTQAASVSPTGTHDADDRTTWAWSANPALAALMIARDDKALGFDDQMIPIQQYADAADDCEVEDGAVSTVELFAEDWVGTTVNAQSVGTAAGSGNWTYNRGSVEVGTGTFGSLNGKPVIKVTSEDTDGTLVKSETGRIGVYIDMRDEGRRGDIEYLLSITGGALASPGGDGKWGIAIYTGDEASREGEVIVNGITSAQQETSFLPPITDASTFKEVYDSGLGDVGSHNVDTTHLVTADFVSFVFYGGEPNEDDIELGELALNTASQAGKTRFRCDGLVVIDERELSLLDPILACMAGHLDTTDGLLGIRAGVWVAPTDTLSQPVGDEIEVRGARDAGFDTVRAKFIGRHREWEETDGPGYALRAGSRIHPLQIGMVREPEQAGRLEKIFGERAEPNRVINATWDGRELNRRLGERVNASLPGMGRAEGTFVIAAKTPVTQEVDDGFEVAAKLMLIEDVAATYAWGSDDFTEPVASTPPKGTSPELLAPTSVTIEQNNYNGAGGATARLKITVAISSDLAQAADRLRIETTDGSGYTHLITVDVESDPEVLSYVVYRDPASVGVTYTARARAESDALGVSDWRISSSLTIVAPTLDYDSADYSAEYA